MVEPELRERILVADPSPTEETPPLFEQDTVSRLCHLVLRHFDARDRCDVHEERATRVELLELARTAPALAQGKDRP